MAKKRKFRRIQYSGPKTCYFCEKKSSPSFSDIETLSKFITDRGKIVSRLRSGLCSKHQREVTKSIKHARHLALLPFVVRG